VTRSRPKLTAPAVPAHAEHGGNRSKCRHLKSAVAAFRGDVRQLGADRLKGSADGGVPVTRAREGELAWASNASARARPAWQEAITVRRSRTRKTAGGGPVRELWAGSRKLRLIVSPCSETRRARVWPPRAAGVVK
jgi:hypothetical protein